MLHSAPSFCIYNTNDGVEEMIGNEDLEGKILVETDGIAALGSKEFSFGKNEMALIEEDDDEEERKEEILTEFKDLGIEDEAVSPWFDGGLEYGPARFDENGDVEEYYKRMIRKDPSNALFLRSYAQFLQSKGDLTRAEDYYFRATKADPKDGEILVQYAILVWDLHHDKDKALKYFEKAVRAAPEDSHVQAAYASFLWELDEEESTSSDKKKQVKEFGDQVEHYNSVYAEDKRPANPSLHLAAGLGVDMAGFAGTFGSIDCMTTDSGDNTNMEDYYRRMIQENPSNPLFLRNYAQFLYETWGDLQLAEEYYSRAIHADPSDGNIIIQYATLIWQLHHNRWEALPYFQQAVQAAPENSNVLAAYARFLWETEEDDEEDIG